MKLFKPFIIISVALFVVWTAGIVQGSDLVPQKWVPGDISGKFGNSAGRHIDLSYTFGSTTPHIYFGYENTKNGDEWKIGANNNTRMLYGASLDYKVSKFFYVIPLFTYYDWGNQPGVTSRPDVNKEWIGGLKFRFVF